MQQTELPALPAARPCQQEQSLLSFLLPVGYLTGHSSRCSDDHNPMWQGQQQAGAGESSEPWSLTQAGGRVLLQNIGPGATVINSLNGITQRNLQVCDGHRHMHAMQWQLYPDSSILTNLPAMYLCQETSWLFMPQKAKSCVV
jgi:hypothetical protein